MLNAVIVGTDKPSLTALRATLQQTGMIHSVREWRPARDKHPAPGEPVPDLVLLDLTSNPDPYFAFSVYLRQLRPTVRIVACSSDPPDPNLLLQAMRSGVQEFLSAPVTPDALRDAISRFAVERAGPAPMIPDNVIVVAGSKGGVGTSTVAVNLGVQVARETKKRVALLDFAYPFGHLSLLLDLQPRFTIRDALLNLDRLDAHFLGGLVTPHKAGLDVLAGAANAEVWQRFTIAGLARIVNVAQSAFDFVLLDAGVVDFSEWAPVMKLARAILLVAEPSLLSLWTLERHLATATSAALDRERIQIVINRWMRNDDGALANVEKNLKQPIHIRLPNDYRQVNEAVTLGMPLAENSSSPLVVRYRELAASLTGTSTAVAEGRRGRALIGLFSGRE